MQRWWVLLAAAAVAASGCLADLDSDDRDRNGIPDDDEPPTAHGDPQRTDGPVEAEQDSNGRWRATQTVSITNGFGEATWGDLRLDTTNGFVAVKGADTGGYLLTASLYATGDTEAAARERLDGLRVVHEDTMSGSTLTLATRVTTQPDMLDALPIDVGGADTQNRGGSLHLLVPDDRLYDVALDTTNGAASAEGIDGDTVTADTTNGRITVEGAWDGLDLDTTNGRITVQGGPRTDGDHQYVAQTTNGAIRFDLWAGADQGYDLTADTTNGGIDIDLPDMQDVGQQSNNHAHERTRDFDQRSQRVTMDLDTTNGGIDVEPL